MKKRWGHTTPGEEHWAILTLPCTDSELQKRRQQKRSAPIKKTSGRLTA